MAVIFWALIFCASRQPKGWVGAGRPFAQRMGPLPVRVATCGWEWPRDAHPLHRACPKDAAGTDAHPLHRTSSGIAAGADNCCMGAHYMMHLKRSASCDDRRLRVSAFCSKTTTGLHTSVPAASPGHALGSGQASAGHPLGQGFTLRGPIPRARGLPSPGYPLAVP